MEVQFYRRPSIFDDPLVKADTYLKQNDPSQPFYGAVLFASRSLEPTGVRPYTHLLDSCRLQRFYLDEMTELADASLSPSILLLIQKSENQAPSAARELIVRVRTEID